MTSAQPAPLIRSLPIETAVLLVQSCVNRIQCSVTTHWEFAVKQMNFQKRLFQIKQAADNQITAENAIAATLQTDCEKSWLV